MKNKIKIKMETKEKLQELIRIEGINSVRKMIDEISLNQPKDWLIEQINDLTIDLKSNPCYIIYMKGDCGYFYYDHKECTLWVSYDKIWSILESKFGLNGQEIRDLCGGTVLKIKVDTTVLPWFDKYPLGG